MVERQEDVVVGLDPLTQGIHLRVDGDDRAEQVHCLVDQVRAQVVEDACPRIDGATIPPGVFGIGSPPFEA